MKNIQIIEELIPRSDKIFASFGKVNYEDNFCLILKTKEIFDLDYIIRKLVISLPNWFKLLLDLRNIFANIFGLKTGKIVKAYEFSEKMNLKQGQFLGDFFIVLNENNHLITELKDRHLDFRFSIMIIEKDTQTKIFFKTIVKINNFFGRIYFLLIKPFHRLIVPNLLKRLSNQI